MALIGNYSVFLKNPATYLSGTSISNCRNAFNAIGQMRQRYYPADNCCTPKASGVPNGYSHPYSWMMPYVAGGMSSRNVVGNGAVSIALGQNGLPAESLIEGSGTISNAAAGLVVEILATIIASGDLEAEVTGFLMATATLVGSSTVTAQQNALAGLVAFLSGVGGLADADQTALAEISALIEVGAIPETLTVDQILTAIKPDLTIINNGVKKASLLIPHTESI